MKKLLLIIFSLYFSTQAFAQKIHFTDTSNVWNELAVFSTGGPPAFNYRTYNFISDTIIGSIAYKWFSFNTGYGGLGSFIREDTTLKKIYIRQYHIDTTHDTDVVLMDYNLNVGDTFTTKYYDTSKNIYIVTGIDSTLISSVWHKVWHFSREVAPSTFSSEWCDVVEGIGCIQHPTYMLEPVGVPGEYAYYMYCFSNRSTTPSLSPPVSFLDNTTSCSTYPTLGIQNIHSQKVFSIFPDPVKTDLNIRSETEPIEQVTIDDLMGREVQHITSFNLTNVVIDVSVLTSGFYILRVNNELTRFVKE